MDRIRRATTDDATAVADVWFRSRRASVPNIPPPARPEPEIRRWMREVMIPTRETWVVHREGQVLAMLVLDDGWVNQLYVDPDHTGRGLGTRLLDLAKERYPSGLQLWAFQANTGARRFYERHGFVAVEMTDGQTNEERAPDVRYVWPARPDV